MLTADYYILNDCPKPCHLATFIPLAFVSFNLMPASTVSFHAVLLADQKLLGWAGYSPPGRTICGEPTKNPLSVSFHHQLTRGGSIESPRSLSYSARILTLVVPRSLSDSARILTQPCPCYWTFWQQLLLLIVNCIQAASDFSFQNETSIQVLTA